jgi:hypothetical protein
MRIIAYGEEEVKSKLKMLDPYLSVVGLEIREWPRRRCGDVQISAHVEAWCDKRLCGESEAVSLGDKLKYLML